MKNLFAFSVAVIALVTTATAQEFSVDENGFIRNWLVLGPIPCESSGSGATEIANEQIKGEAKLAPKAGDKIKVGDTALEWKTGKAEDYYFDFNVWLKNPDDQKAESVIGYLCATVVASEELKGIEARLGSNDQGRLYINGKEAFTFDQTRTIAEDSDTVPNVTLNKGENTIVFKIINESNNWQGCLRFVGKDGKPIKNLKVVLAK